MIERKRARTESILREPGRASVIFLLAGVIAGLVAVPGWNGSGSSFVVLWILIGAAFAGAGLFWKFGDQIGLRGHQATMVVSVVIVSIATRVEPDSHVNFDVLYIWAAVYSALYFSRIAYLLQTAFAGIAYFVVLLSEHISARWLFLTWFSIFGTAIMLSGVVFVLVGVLRKISREDPLTRLANRRAWEERVVEEMERARRTEAALSLVVIDIDNFKGVNDREGHQAGDRLLRRFAEGWLEAVRGSGDFIARLGGDEFGLLVPGSGELGLKKVVERLRRVTPGGVSCSIGAATWDRTETAANLFRRADEAMYGGKRHPFDE